MKIIVRLLFVLITSLLATSALATWWGHNDICDDLYGAARYTCKLYCGANAGGKVLNCTGDHPSIFCPKVKKIFQYVTHGETLPCERCACTDNNEFWESAIMDLETFGCDSRQAVGGPVQYLADVKNSNDASYGNILLYTSFNVDSQSGVCLAFDDSASTFPTIPLTSVESYNNCVNIMQATCPNYAQDLEEAIIP